MTTTEDQIIKINEIPVTFYDGEREINLGKVQITPIMTFKLLQSTLSNKIGISPNHITIYLDRNNNNNDGNYRRRHPVTSKFDFSSLDTDRSFLWVVLKRGRRNRRRRKNDVVDSNTSAPFVLLRRSGSEFDNQLEYIEYVNRLRMIEIERQKEINYFMSLNINSHVYNELSGGSYNYNYDYDYDYNNNSSGYSDEYYSSCSSNSGANTINNERVFCEVCCNEVNGGGDDVASFHWCKNDVIVVNRYRSVVGPIAPPNKKNGIHS